MYSKGWWRRWGNSANLGEEMLVVVEEVVDASDSGNNDGERNNDVLAM